MSDINDVLSKHFVGEVSPTEERLVQQFKLENPEEYQALKALWTQEKVDLVEVDTAKAWDNVVRQATPAKEVILLPRLRKIAAIAAIFLIALGGGYFYLNQALSSETIALKATVQNQKVILADGSVIHLNKNASLSYPQTMDGRTREVKLEGEAFFEIAKDASRPFIVHTLHSDVEVLGTSFNINTQKEQTEISVATGKVNVKSLHSSEAVILTPEQSAVVDAKKIDHFTTVPPNYLAWKTGNFHFEKSPLQQVVNDLNNYYEDKISLAVNDSNCLFSSTFKQRDLKEIVEIIQLSCSLQLTNKNGHYELY